jgi:hypothetical protein
MKPRHLIRIAVAGPLLAGLLAGCSLLGFVSITERVAQFQVDLNSSTRVALYENFHPDLCYDYSALKDPVATIDTPMPRVGTGTQYVLSITDDTAPSNGVIVTVTAGPAAYGTTPKYLKLVMEISGLGDYRIASFEQSTTLSFPGPALYE